MPYPGYQTFKMIDSTSSTGVRTYCSSAIVQNHAAGSAWINNAITHFQLNAQNMHGTPAVVQRQPTGANVTIY